MTGERISSAGIVELFLQKALRLGITVSAETSWRLNISSDWKSIIRNVADSIPYTAYVCGIVDLPGVYLLIKNNVCEYVGQGVSIKKRLSRHPHYKKDEHLVISLVYYKLGTGDSRRDRAETALIALINPPKNKVKTVKGKRR